MANAKPENGKQAANPKQLLILAALLAVLVTVGVVQFGGLFGGGAPPAPNPSWQANGGAQSQASQTAQASETRATLPPLSPRDPFRPVIVAAKPQQEEPSRIVRTEPTNRPKREITGTPPLAPMTLPPGQFGLQHAENAPEPRHGRRAGTKLRRDFSGQRGTPTLRQAGRPAGRRLARGQHPARRTRAAERQTAHHHPRRRIDRP
jgi:hypothetical protein